MLADAGRVISKATVKKLMLFKGRLLRLLRGKPTPGKFRLYLGSVCRLSIFNWQHQHFYRLNCVATFTIGAT